MGLRGRGNEAIPGQPEGGSCLLLGMKCITLIRAFNAGSYEPLMSPRRGSLCCRVFRDGGVRYSATMYGRGTVLCIIWCQRWRGSAGPFYRVVRHEKIHRETLDASRTRATRSHELEAIISVYSVLYRGRLPVDDQWATLYGFLETCRTVCVGESGDKTSTFYIWLSWHLPLADIKNENYALR